MVAACRPPVPNDSRRLSLAGGAAPLAELDFRQPSPPPSPGGAAPADAAEGLLRDVVLPAGSGAGPAAGGASQGTSGGASGGAVFRLPVYGYLGGGDGRLLCEREVGPLVERLQAGESAAVLAFGQTGACAGVVPCPRGSRQREPALLLYRGSACACGAVRALRPRHAQHTLSAPAAGRHGQELHAGHGEAGGGAGAAAAQRWVPAGRRPAVRCRCILEVPLACWMGAPDQAPSAATHRVPCAARSGRLLRAPRV